MRLLLGERLMAVSFMSKTLIGSFKTSTSDPRSSLVSENHYLIPFPESEPFDSSGILLINAVLILNYPTNF